MSPHTIGTVVGLLGGILGLVASFLQWAQQVGARRARLRRYADEVVIKREIKGGDAPSPCGVTAAIGRCTTSSPTQRSTRCFARPRRGLRSKTSPAKCARGAIKPAVRLLRSRRCYAMTAAQEPKRSARRAIASANPSSARYAGCRGTLRRERPGRSANGPTLQTPPRPRDRPRCAGRHPPHFPHRATRGAYPEGVDRGMMDRIKGRHRSHGFLFADRWLIGGVADANWTLRGCVTRRVSQSDQTVNTLISDGGVALGVVGLVDHEALLVALLCPTERARRSQITTQAARSSPDIRPRHHCFGESNDPTSPSRAETLRFS